MCTTGLSAYTVFTAYVAVAASTAAHTQYMSGGADWGGGCVDGRMDGWAGTTKVSLLVLPGGRGLLPKGPIDRRACFPCFSMGSGANPKDSGPQSLLAGAGLIDWVP